MRTFHYSTAFRVKNALLEPGDTIIVSMSVMNMDYARWVTSLSEYGRNFIYEVIPEPLYGFKVKKLNPIPHQITI